MNLQLEGFHAIVANAETEAGGAVARALAGEGARLSLDGSAEAAAAADRRSPVGAAVFVLPPLPEGGFASLEAEVVRQALQQVDAVAGLFKALAPAMQARGFGRFLFVGPVEAKAMTARSADLDRTVGLAVLGLMKAMSGELGPHGVTCNAILWDSGRTGAERSRILTATGAMTAYLASPLSGFLTGLVVGVDDARQGGVF